MCNYKILAHNDDGYVILCNNCGHYHLAFGTTAVTFGQKNFRLFRDQVEALRTGTAADGFEKQKRISLDIFAANSLMVLSYHEVLKLSSLLDETGFSEEIENLLNDLNLKKN